MSSSCPSCGSAVEAGATICPVCGEPLQESPLIAEGYDLPAVAEPAVAGINAPSKPGPVRICPKCSRENPADAAFCSNCGTRLDAEEKAGRKSIAPAKAEGSRSGTYMIATVAVMLIAGAAYIAAPKYYPTPTRSSEPAAQQPDADGAVPPGHPSMDGAAPKGPSPELVGMIADAEKEVAAKPADLDLKLKLGNLYYDAEEYPKAIPIYREFLKAHPDDDNVRTDMAFSIVASNGNVDSATSELYRVARHNPKHQNAAYYLSMIYYSKKNRDSTIYWLNRVMEIDSTTRQGKFAASVLKDPSLASPHGAPGM